MEVWRLNNPHRVEAIVEEIAGSGGGGASHAHYNLVGPVASGQPPSALSWAQPAGDDLLDLTDPANPAVKAQGHYLVTLYLAGPISPGHALLAELDLDLNGEDVLVMGQVPLTAVNGYSGRLTLALAYYVPLGGVLWVGAAHDTGLDETIGGLAFVTRLA